MTEQELLKVIKKATIERATYLDLKWKNLSSLPPEIGQLSSLQSLDLRSNQLSSLPPEIGQLSSLQSLGLQGNQLSSLPPEIGQLSSLQSLVLQSNQLSSLPPEIGQLSSLQSLDLQGNQLSSLPPEIGQLNHLHILDISFNKLTHLPPGIERIAKVNYGSNQFTSIPPEIRKKGWNSVRQFLKQQANEEVDKICEAKLLIVGEGGAGKTTLAKKIKDPTYRLDSGEKSTEGIEIIQWKFPFKEGKEFIVNIWDFGGQEIYHATHQFFLTKRSLYLLVADSRKEDTDFFYWLNVADLLSDSSPILIIKNEKQDRKREINEGQLRGEFTNLKDTFATNLATNRGLSAIQQAIEHYITHLDHIGTELPKTWVNVRRALETDPRDHITVEEYLTICEEQGFTHTEDALQLSGYLHDLGVCLHFQEDDLLRKTVILKPTWGTDAVYRVLDNPEVINNLGKFDRDILATIWHEAKYATMHPELLRLMMNFKLCYEIPNQRHTYIAPQLLGPNQPNYKWNDTDNLLLRYTYDFMPKGILTRFIVEMHPSIEDQTCVWRTGVVLQKESARAKVSELYHRREICIRISGHRKRDLLTTIRHELDKIHNSYERLQYNTLVPCNCTTCKDKPEPHFYAFKDLQERLDFGQLTVQCGKPPYETIKISRLIDYVTREPMPQNPASKRDRVFISYSHKDDKWRQDLMTHLAPFIQAKNLNVWDDTQIEPGAKWREEIEAALVATKVAVLLVSADFLASKFINEQELPRFLEAEESDGLKILWIPIRPSSYKYTSINTYQAAYKPDHPLSRLSEDEQEDAWVTICDRIQMAFES